MSEVWKAIDDCAGYEVSNLGRVRSLKRHGVRIMPQTIQKNGYRYVTVWNKSKNHCLRVHRIVAQAFVPNPDGLPLVNHIDGDKTNNHASNLEWCTQSQNMKHSFRTGLQTPHRWTDEEKKQISNKVKEYWKKKQK